MRRFEPHEAPIFFGREGESENLAELLLDCQVGLVLVLGASGTGKSSLVSAGALPELATRGHKWPVLSFAPGDAGDNPFLALAIELAKQLAPSRKPGELAQILASKPASLMEFAREILREHPAGSSLVLFVDQFEELFKEAAQRHKRAFIELIVAAADDGCLRTVVTLREDFHGAFAREPALIALVQNGRSLFPVGGPANTALNKMIRGPAECAGLTLEDELIDQLIADAGPNPGEALPLVAFCLEQLYRHVQPRSHIGSDDYLAIGGLRGAIGQRVNQIFDRPGIDRSQLTPTLERIFPLVVHVEASGKAVRQWAPRHAFAQPGSVSTIAEELIENGLLLARRSEMVEVVTLRHEALIQEWTELQNWIDRNVEHLRRVQPLLLLLPSAMDRRHAIDSLVGLHPKCGDLIVRSLSNILGDADADVRWAAVGALSRIGPAAADAVPALIEALRDTTEVIGKAAAEALGRIGPAAVDGVPALIAALSDDNEAIRVAAVGALGRIGPAAADAVPALIEALSDDNDAIRVAAAKALSRIGLAAGDAVPALIEALRDAHAGVRKAAAEALGWIGPAAGDAVPALIEALRDANAGVHVAAAKALSRIGPAAADVIPALIEALRDANAGVRWSATWALSRIGPAAADAVPALIGALRDAHAGVRRAAAEALGRIGPVAANAVPALIEALDDKHVGVRKAVAGALSGIGAAAAEAVPALIGALRDGGEGVREAAAETLGKIGPAAAEAMPALINALRDANTDVRTAAGEALRRIRS